MALVSPGVQVSVIDESFYTPAEPGTTPIIFVATAENKTNGSGTGIAAGTLAANAGKVYLISSQRDLVETFGDPTFYTDVNNNPINGGEQNEYGLQAAYSFLGVSNRAYVVRADIDLAALNASDTPTAGEPTDGTYWLDTQTTAWGIFEWNSASITTSGGQTFTNKTPIVITSTQDLVGGSATADPKSSVGAIGDYAVRTTTRTVKTYYKGKNGWAEVGSANWKAAWPSVTGTNANVSVSVSDGFTIQDDGASTIATITSTGTTLTQLAADITSTASGVGITADVVDGYLNIYNNGSTTPSISFTDGTGTPLAAAGIATATDFAAPALQISAHTSVPEFKTGDTTPRPTGSIWLKTTEPNLGARWRVSQYNGDTQLWDSVAAPIYATNHAALYALDRSGGGANLLEGDVYVQYNVAEDADTFGTFKLFVRNASGPTVIRSSKVTATTFASIAGSVTFGVSESVKGQMAMSGFSTATATVAGSSADADAIAGAINDLGLNHVVASVDSQNRIVITHTAGGDIRFSDTDGALSAAGFVAFDVDDLTGTENLYYTPGSDALDDPLQLIATLWKPMTYTASDDAPSTLAADGALWYSSVVDEVDIMVHDGQNWVGYLSATSPYYNASEAEQTDPAGPIVSASEPTAQSDGTALKNGDIWVSTADIDNYPAIYKYNSTLGNWIELDKTDQTTENGVLFADARWTDAGTNAGADASTIEELLVSDHLDPDAPDPALYPKGMLLWNLRRSGFNVKRFERNYIDTSGDNPRAGDEAMADYYPHRWVTESANNVDGSGSFGRNAQRKVVVQALQALVNSNEDIRDNETRLFNLMATPGYPELIGEMISLNYDRGLTAFVVGDSPARLTPDATSLNEWATNVNTVVEDNDNGLVSRDEYMGVYYPWGYSSDNIGNNIVVPPSHMVLRTIALNDQVAYPWFAPAGTRRGGVTNATATGYINAEGEFVSVALNEGQRDTLYQNNVNPITFLTGAGLVVFGQKTRARNASALDRVNVARLVVYLRSQLNSLAKPYLFEPNDKITRDEIKQQVESLMVELVGLRALYDFLVVCDESNNTPARIDRNELYVDIAIEPVKAVEFIYIPLRIKNTGEISGL